MVADTVAMVVSFGVTRCANGGMNASADGDGKIGQDLASVQGKEKLVG